MTQAVKCRKKQRLNTADTLAGNAKRCAADIVQMSGGSSRNHSCGLFAFEVKIFGCGKAKTISELCPSRALLSAACHVLDVFN